MFHFPPRRLVWLATCCLLMCNVHAQIQMPCDAGTSIAACQCPANSLEGTQVLNPPYAQRKYSSVFTNDHFGSRLDDTSNGGAWSSWSNSIGDWMEIDTGAPKNIVGVISQGRHNVEQWITRFTVQYRLDGNINVALSQTFLATDGSKKTHLLSVPIYARHVRITVGQFMNHVSMRAGLLVKACV